MGPREKGSNAGKPRKHAHPLGRNRGSKRPSIGWLAANRRTIPDAVFGFPAKQCAAVACSGNPSRLTRPRDEIDLPVAGSAGDDALDHQAELARRTNTPVSVQLEVGQKDTENNNLRHHLCVIYLTETCCRQNNSLHFSKVNLIIIFWAIHRCSQPARIEIRASLRAPATVAPAPRNLRSTGIREGLHRSL